MNVTAFKRRKEFGKTLASDIAHRMRNEIVTCRLKPGEVLKFDTLRLAYGASFTTLREALTCLAAEGLVVAEEQRGFKVAPISLADLIDLTRARILIEVDLIRRSIENGDDDWEIAVISSIHRLGMIEGREVEDYADNPEWKAGAPGVSRIPGRGLRLADPARHPAIAVRTRRALSQYLGKVPATSARQGRRAPRADEGRRRPRCQPRLRADRKAHPEHHRQRHQIRFGIVQPELNRSGLGDRAETRAFRAETEFRLYHFRK